MTGEMSGKPTGTKGKEGNLEKLVHELVAKVNVMEKRMEAQENENKDLKKKIASLERDLSEKSGMVKQEVKRVVEDTVKSESFADKLKKGLRVEPGKVVEQVAELQDRRYNLIFRGALESDKEDLEERKAHDEKQIKVIAEKAGLPKSFLNSVVSIRRIGKRADGVSYRPLLIRLTSQDQREKALRSNLELRDFNQSKGTRYRIEPDLTREQRERLTNLWEEANKKSKNGKKFFVIGKENPVLRWRAVEEEKSE